MDNKLIICFFKISSTDNVSDYVYRLISITFDVTGPYRSMVYCLGSFSRT
jgi:hypothetical protein